MSLEDKIPEANMGVGECNHPYLRHDGAWQEMAQGLYTCRHPDPDVPQCHGSFLEQRFNWDDWQEAFWHEDHQYFIRKRFNND